VTDQFPETRCVGVSVLWFSLLAIVDLFVDGGSGLGATGCRLTFFGCIDKVLVSLVLWLNKHSL
jgi:hypothetical protein